MPFGLVNALPSPGIAAKDQIRGLPGNVMIMNLCLWWKKPVKNMWSGTTANLIYDMFWRIAVLYSAFAPLLPNQVPSYLRVFRAITSFVQCTAPDDQANAHVANDGSRHCVFRKE